MIIALSSGRYLSKAHSMHACVEGTNLTTPGDVGLSGSPVWIVSITADGTPLTMFADYNIVKGNLHIYTDLDDTTVVVVNYWAYGNPEGFTPGGLSWDTVLEGGGMYYIISFTPGVGGGASFKRNPYYWMPTPPLGEMDFEWNHVGTVKPRCGYYDVDIYDVVWAADAYGATATGVPSPRYKA
jgi:hypothetical protein